MKKLHVIALLIVLGMAQRAGAQNYTQQVTAIQYFYNTDPGVGVAGNGAIISISPASSINQAFAFTVPPSLSNGINFLYVRAKDEFGKWSIAERKALFVFTPQATQDISAIQYYFDTDPGVGIAGNGAVQTITPASSISPSMGIVVPNSLSTGIHFLYIRVKDVNKSWSLVERKPFFIQQVQGTQQVTAMEYYYDTDPGCGNGNVIPITPAASVAAIFPLGVPCLSTGTHYMYVRAKDESGRWSLIERDTITVNSGIAAAVVSPAGPVAICSNSSVTLSFTPSPGVSYQWLLNGNNIAGATGSSYVVTAAGNYSLKSTCGSSFITSNVVTVTTLTLLTYYADGDGDGYGNLSVTTQACTQPSGYVLNSTDCNDSNVNIHPGAPETCNLIDDDCDGLTDEGVQLTFYADADNDGYGNPSLSQVACTAPTGFVANDDDCDDANMNVHPNATEICNQIDDDCDGSIDESLVGNGIVGHWEFDGNGDDQSSGNFDLALSGSPSFSQGKYGQAMDLDGTGNKYAARTVDDEIFDFAANPFTISLWVNFNSISSEQTLMEKFANQSGPGWTLTKLSSQQIQFYFGTPLNSSTLSIATGTWHHIAVTRTGNDFKIYFDGAEVAAVNNSSSIPNTVKPLLIGRRNFEDGRIFGVNGHLDDVAIWSRGLTTSEVANLWNGGQLSLTTRYYADSDGDGFGNAASSVLACTPPSGYVTNANDCDDANPNVNPAAIEICNYVDDNCNGQIDEGLQSTFYADADHDGYGNPSVSLLACTQPTGYVTNDDDCNDGNMNVHPGATETCNGLDDNCDGLTDDADPTVTGQSTWYQDADHDGYGNSALSFLACSAPTGYVANDDDCDDTNMNIHPGATETCNLVDDDCDGLIDEGTVLTFYADADGDGYGDATHSQVGCITPSGYVANDDDCNDANNAIHPGALEICNLIDDDCDGLVDEGVKLTFYADSDNDGYGNPASSVLACVQPSGYVANNNDCNDNNANVHPGASEICNSLDDNCDGQIDEGYAISVAASSVSSSNGNNFCPGGSTLLSVVGGSLGTGADWFWYEGGCGSGSSIGTGSSVSVAPSSGVHTYYVRAEGSCNTSACTSTSITVYSSPAFTSCPSDITAGNTSSLCSAIRTYSALASGNPAPSLSYTFSGATTGSGTGTGSGSVFNKGTTLVTITAINSCGSSICSFNITINDSEGPVISGCPSATNAVVEEGQWGAHVSWTPPTATDNCGMGTITSTRMPGDFFNVGSTVVTYTATDVNGNSSTCQFYVTVAPPDLVGKVNISVSSDNIHFSEDNPDPGSTVNVSALVVNNSKLDAANFNVQLKDLYSNTTYAPATVSFLAAAQSVQVSWVITMPTLDAFIPLQVTADVLNTLDESNEFDNVAVKPIICGAPSSLGTMGVGTNPVPASVAAGSVIQLCGHAEYEDTNPPLADPSVAGASIVITITETGQSFSGYTDEGGNFCIAYQTPITPGLYHYTVEITDNTLGGDASGTFTTTPPPPPPCVKDLAVSIDVSGILPDFDGHYTVTVGTTFSGTVHVLNNCQSVTQSTILFIGLPLGTPVPGPFTIPPLGPGQVYNVSLPVMTLNQPGNGYISATVDYTNVVTEAFEYNNTDHKLIKVLPLLPDLRVIGGDVLSPDFCQSGNQLNFIVKNVGVVNSGSYNAVFEFYGNNTLQGTETQILPNLAPGAQTILTFPFTPAFLIDSFELTVDTPNVITELSEFNNQRSFSYAFVPCKADLVVMGCHYFDVKPADPLPASTLSVEALIKNAGDLTVSDPFNVSFNIAGTIVTVPVTTTIAPGQVISVMASGPAPSAPGNSVSVTADAGNVIVEKSEGNNGYSAPLCYDFEFTNFNCLGEPIFKSTQYYCSTGEFRIGLWNYGVYEASHLEVKFEISGPGLDGWVNLGTVTSYVGNSCECPGDVSLPNSFYFPQTGTYQVRMTVDPNNQYAECNESGSQVIYAVNVIESVDYKILSSYITPSDLNPDINEVVSFNVSYGNIGCAGFNPMELYTRVDNTPLDSLVVSALPGGGFASVAIPQTWSSAVPGMHVFRAIIDHDNQFSESDENNNEATRAIIVGAAPDYHVLTLTSSSMAPVFGQSLTLTTTVHNDGQSAGSGLLQFLYQAGSDNEVLIDQQDISILPATTITRSVPWIAVEPHARIIVRVINVVPVESDFTDNEKELQLTPMSIQTISTDVPCADISLGSLEVDITGGESPFTAHWSNGMDGQLIHVGSGTYVVTVTDALGATAIAFDTVMDLELPVIWYQDADNDGFGNPNVHLYQCDAPTGYVGTGTDCNDTNATIYPEATEIADGKDNDCDGLVDEGLAVLDVNAGDCEIVYLGYSSSQCQTLTVSVTGGTTPYTYLWSNGATTQTISACPTVTTIYTVTVTDHNGSTAKDKVTVQVIDIRCGNNNNKVVVCHIPPGNPNNPQMICIAPSAVPAHLAHGDYLGICAAADPCEIPDDPIHAIQDQINPLAENQIEMQSQSNPALVEDESISIHPNPADEYIELNFPVSLQPYDVQLYDVTGKLLRNLSFDSGKHQLTTAELENGVYIIQIKSLTSKMTSAIMVLH